MTPITDRLIELMNSQALTGPASSDLKASLKTLGESESFEQLLRTLTEAPAFSDELGADFAAAQAVEGISACRMLRGALNLPLGQFFVLLGRLFEALDSTEGKQKARSPWSEFANQIMHSTPLAQTKLLTYLTTVTDDSVRHRFTDMATRLGESDPHAIYPTSVYRECGGSVQCTSDQQTVEALMSFSTFASIRTIDHALDVKQPALRDIYKPLGRCICLIDETVEKLHGAAFEAYFDSHEIVLEKRVYRAMEADKGLSTVERMLGDFKHLGVSRNEPVLIAGGGVLADTGGLACALYGRNTPYVMLSTSIVTGIDAGPSPRTCCDGFGYKNLMGAYHPPIVSITDRFFFETLHEGWLRHGIAEIIKMAVVKNLELFNDLEAAQSRLIDTRFGTIDCAPDDDINDLSQRILGGALKSYIEAEYGNLFETHQCRPHAYGHTWSPGFEIEAGLLHGHAVAIGMGYGAFLSARAGWITDEELHRILRLMSGYGLSLTHDILNNRPVMLESHRKILQKRGGNLVAPIPKGSIGECGYLNSLSEEELFETLNDYQALCADYPRGGLGIDAHCRDVGLKDPSTAEIR
nr:sedoheptulose 7-phosphate cyclase [uncultured Halomonas sp.]